MAVKYTVSEKGNPLNPTQQKKWYAGAFSAGDTTLRALSKEIAARSAVCPADTQAVLVVRMSNLAEGKIVRSDDFGSFQASVSSEGAETEAKFTDSLIKGSKMVFRQGIDFKEMFRNLKYEKAQSFY
jgi:predicted histone-like DNA-binding protein